MGVACFSNIIQWFTGILILLFLGIGLLGAI